MDALWRNGARPLAEDARHPLPAAYRGLPAVASSGVMVKAVHPPTPDLPDSLPSLRDGRLSVPALRRWSGAFDALSGGERYRAADFVEWLEDNLPRSDPLFSRDDLAE